MTAVVSTRRVSSTWPLLAAAATHAGALLFLAGQALLPELPDDWDPAFAGMLAHRDQLMAARLLTAAGCFLLVVTGIAFADVLARRAHGSRTVRVGGTLFAVGAFFNALSQAVAGYATYAATTPGLDHAAGEAMLKRLTAGATGLPLDFWSIPVLALGALLVAVGLLVSRTPPAWLAALLIVGTVLAGALAGQGPVVALTQVPFTLALIILAVAFPRTADDA
jgi:hypothetical protein